MTVSIATTGSHQPAAGLSWCVTVLEGSACRSTCVTIALVRMTSGWTTKLSYAIESCDIDVSSPPPGIRASDAGLPLCKPKPTFG